MTISNETANRIFNNIYLEESYRAFPYKDTDGNWTLGIGWNIFTRGCNLKIATFACKEHISESDQDLTNNLSFYNQLDEVRKAALIDMAFNMGIKNLLGFQNMLKAIQENNWDTASKECLNSSYGTKLKSRAQKIAKMLLTGEWL